jgi:hypothetical protein
VILTTVRPIVTLIPRRRVQLGETKYSNAGGVSTTNTPVKTGTCRVDFLTGGRAR